MSRSIQRASDTPCFARLIASFAGSKSTIIVYTICSRFRQDEAGVPCNHPLKTASEPPAINAAQEQRSGSEIDDLRDPRLPLSAGPVAGAAEALREHHLKTLREARHQAGRVLHHAGRRIQSGTDLSAGMGIAGRSREEMERFPERSRMDRGARQDRGRRPDRRQHRQSTAGAYLILIGEMTGA